MWKGCAILLIILLILGFLAAVGILDLDLIWEYRFGPGP